MGAHDYNKTECINREIFSQNPSAEIVFFEIYDIANTSDVIRFHGGVNNYTRSLFFDAKEYFYVPFLEEDFGVRSDGKMSRPSLSLINFQGFFSRYIKDKDDLLGAKVRRIKTFIRFIDEVNFLNYSGDQDYWRSMGINPDPLSKLRDEEWVINQKVTENKNLIKYELSSPLDLENAVIPNRQIINNYCVWKYRGNGCKYSGVPCADSNDVKFTGALNNRGVWAEGVAYAKNDFVSISVREGNSSRNVVFVCISNHTSSEDKKPSINSSLWAQDSCSKSLRGCKLRFTGEEDDHLPFGGFPGSRLF